MVVASLIVASMAGVIGREAGTAIARATVGETATDVLARPWEAFEVAGLTISSPTPFVRYELNFPSDARTVIEQGIEAIENFRADAGPVQVLLTQFIVKPHIQPSLEGAADGAVSRVSKLPAVTDLRHHKTDVRVSGYPAIRVSASYTEDDRPFRAEMLFLVAGQRVWQISTTFTALEPSRTVAERLLASVRFDQ